MEQERTDALDAVDWLTSRPWYDETAGVGVFGMSYLFPASLAAVARHSAVATATNIAGFADLYSVTHHDDVGKTHHMLPWTVRRRHPDADLESVDWATAFRTVPLTGAASEAGYPSDLWTEWCALSEEPSRRDAWSLAGLLEDVTVPTLHIGGWYDLCLDSTLRVYERIKAAATAPQHLVLGPWRHNGFFGSETSLHGVEFGDESQPAVLAHVAAWFRRWLGGATDALDDTPLTTESKPVAAFATGANEWLQPGRWPPSDVERTTLYPTGTGSLARQKPDRDAEVTVPVDPGEPVPTAGGTVFDTHNLSAGPADRSHLHDRDDVRTFVGARLAAPLTVAGPVDCELTVSTERAPAMLAVTLLDCWPDGAARVVADGVARVDPNDSAPSGTSERTVSVDCWVAAHEFATGHRVGLEVAGSDFPRFERLPPNGDPFEQRVHVGLDAASRLQLATLDRPQSG
jgi:putative CocE/NonD family hydrolase